MKIQNFIWMGVGSVLVVFMFLSWFYQTGTDYGIYENESIGNISLSDYQDSLESAQETAETLQEVFNTESITVTAFNLIVKGIPSAAKTTFRWSIDSVHLVLVGATKVFATPAFAITLGVLISVLIVIFIIVNWDWIRGVVTGT